MENGRVSASVPQGGGHLTLSGLGMDQQVFDSGLQFFDVRVVSGPLTRQVALQSLDQLSLIVDFGKQ